ncbi:nitrile hydratase accessory protein [Sneathiella aquimaris]|uniref:nitrile hydratase accessory protein n=1 Tax=Sneathiella aquimaris TaxID=2599305 RepID=UPI00146CA421|nr:nitrile hydratase accessory protein [Sneathiella aquimaris]
MSGLEPVLEDMDIPRNEDGPVFDEPWQAQAFAMTVGLHEKGLFSWSEWADIFGAQIAEATQQGRGCGNENYYLCWLAALEILVDQKKLISLDQLSVRKEEWRQANAHTDHGKPITLDPERI